MQKLVEKSEVPLEHIKQMIGAEPPSDDESDEDYEDKDEAKAKKKLKSKHRCACSCNCIYGTGTPDVVALV